jgi:ATP-dependent DNA ligase
LRRRRRAELRSHPLPYRNTLAAWRFDLIELDGADLRRDPLAVRKATLASVLSRAAPGLRFNEHIEANGPTVFAHSCKMGLEGIVSKAQRLALPLGALTRLAQEQEPSVA